MIVPIKRDWKKVPNYTFAIQFPSKFNQKCFDEQINSNNVQFGCNHRAISIFYIIFGFFCRLQFLCSRPIHLNQHKMHQQWENVNLIDCARWSAVHVKKNQTAWIEFANIVQNRKVQNQVHWIWMNHCNFRKYKLNKDTLLSIKNTSNHLVVIILLEIRKKCLLILISMVK